MNKGECNLKGWTLPQEHKDMLNWFISTVCLTVKIFNHRRSKYKIEYCDGFGLNIVTDYKEYNDSLWLEPD